MDKRRSVEQLRQAVLTASDRRHGLALQLVVASCITKAPGGGQTAGPSPVDRRKQGLKRSPSRPLAILAAPGKPSR